MVIIMSMAGFHHNLPQSMIASIISNRNHKSNLFIQFKLLNKNVLLSKLVTLCS